MGVFFICLNLIAIRNIFQNSLPSTGLIYFGIGGILLIGKGKRGNKRMRVLAKLEAKRVIMERGYTVIDIARMIDMSPQGMRQVFNRKNGIKPSNAKAVKDLVGVEFNEIFEIVEWENE